MRPISLLLACSALCLTLAACGSGNSASTGAPFLTLKWSRPDLSAGNSVLNGRLLFSGKTLRAMNLDTKTLAFDLPHNTDIELRNFLPFGDALIAQTYNFKLNVYTNESLQILTKDGRILNSILLPGGTAGTTGVNGPVLTEHFLYTSSGPNLYRFNRADLLKPDATPVWVKTYTHYSLASFIALDDNHVFVAPSDGSNRVIALDGDGKERWTAQSASPTTTAAQSLAMAPYRDTLIISAGTGGLMALKQDTGKPAWEAWANLNICPETSSISGQITVADDKIFLAPIFGTCVFAYHADTGKPAWAFNSPRTLTFGQTPLYHNGVVYASDSTLYALDANTGKILAQSKENVKQTFGAPLVYDPQRNEILHWGLAGLHAFAPVK